MTTWIATTQDNKLADKSSEIESTHATSASDLQLDGNEFLDDRIDHCKYRHTDEHSREAQEFAKDQDGKDY